MSNIPSLGRLKKIDLRNAWEYEDRHFTPWLAQEENLALLGEAIGMEFEFEAQEQQVGPFRADILCRDIDSGNWVLIENQLEKTDHSHLGQLITYAAGLNAVTIVWIAKAFSEEHRAALDWLNERTDEQINLFGLEVELWQIGDSAIAPKFNVVCQPNDWSRSIRKSTDGAGEPTPYKLSQARFWEAFKGYLEEEKSVIRCGKASSNTYRNHSIGLSGVHLASVASNWDTESKKVSNGIRAEVYLKGDNARQVFDLLINDRPVIEKELGFSLVWYEMKTGGKCKIYIRRESDFTDESLWPEQFNWLRETNEALYRVFRPRLMKLKEELE